MIQFFFKIGLELRIILPENVIEWCNNRLAENDVSDFVLELSFLRCDCDIEAYFKKINLPDPYFLKDCELLLLLSKLIDKFENKNLFEKVNSISNFTENVTLKYIADYYDDQISLCIDGTIATPLEKVYEDLKKDLLELIVTLRPI